jgi:hypothetical protein
MIAQGIEAPDWGDDGDEEFPEQPIHAIIDVGAVAAPKWSAFKSHRTQFGADSFFLKAPEEFVLKMLGTEYFEQAWPDTKPDQPYTDIFAGLDNENNENIVATTLSQRSTSDVS